MYTTKILKEGTRGELWGHQWVPRISNPSGGKKMCTRPQGIRLPHEASCIPWMAPGLSFASTSWIRSRCSWRGNRRFDALRIPVDRCKLSCGPPMRQHSPPRFGSGPPTNPLKGRKNFFPPPRPFSRSGERDFLMNPIMVI